MGGGPFKREDTGKAARWGNRVLLGLFGLVAASMVVLIGLSFIMPPVLQGVVDDLTEAEPVVFEDSALPEPELEAVEARLDAFETAVQQGAAVDPLNISDRELNGFLADSEDTRDRVRIALQGGQLRAQMSIPIDSDLEIGPWRGQMRGRYLNGVAVLKPTIVSDGLSVKLTDFVVKGESVPGWMHAMLQREIDRLDWLDSQDVEEAVSKLDSIQIVDDRLVLYPKR